MSSKSNILLDTGTNELEVVEFTLEYKNTEKPTKYQYYGVNVIKVHEIIRMPELTQMPNQTKSIVGVFTLREKIMPALDLKMVLNGTPSDLEESKMIITEFNRTRMGLIVSDVKRIHRVSWTEIISPDFEQDYDPSQSSVTGILQMPDRHILMLDVEKIIADIDARISAEFNVEVAHFENKPIAVTAEDSSLIRKMITDRLVAAGFEIKSFVDGQQAWDFLQGVSEKVSKGEDIKNLVNVVITDIEMPNLDGYTLTKKIKENQYLSNLPVAIFSSIITDELYHKGKAVGADAQLSKPQLGELLETVRSLLAKYSSI